MDIGDASRPSGISIQKKSKREGYCNACSCVYLEKYEIVYEIIIGQSAFRLCPHCMDVLKAKIKGIAK
jgi:hypothetical protein